MVYCSELLFVTNLCHLKRCGACFFGFGFESLKYRVWGVGCMLYQRVECVVCVSQHHLLCRLDHIPQIGLVHGRVEGEGVAPSCLSLSLSLTSLSRTPTP